MLFDFWLISCQCIDLTVIALKNHIRTKFVDHWRMFLALNAKDAPSPTSHEVDIANGKISMTIEIARKYKQKVDNIEGNIVDAFKKQTEVPNYLSS